MFHKTERFLCMVSYKYNIFNGVPERRCEFAKWPLKVRTRTTFERWSVHFAFPDSFSLIVRREKNRTEERRNRKSNEKLAVFMSRIKNRKSFYCCRYGALPPIFIVLAAKVSSFFSFSKKYIFSLISSYFAYIFTKIKIRKIQFLQGFLKLNNNCYICMYTIRSFRCFFELFSLSLLSM